MKREAETLRTNVRELAIELAEDGGPMPANVFLVTKHNNRVISPRLYQRDTGEEIARPMNITNQEACELAVWLVISAGLTEDMSMEEAREYFFRAYQEALEA